MGKLMKIYGHFFYEEILFTFPEPFFVYTQNLMIQSNIFGQNVNNIIKRKS